MRHDGVVSMAPGWYPDPFSSGRYLRWWDGYSWGAQTSDAAAVLPPAGVGAPVPPALQPTFPVASWAARLGAYLLDALLVALATAPLLLWALWGTVTTFASTAGPNPTPAHLEAFTDSIRSRSLQLSLIALVVSYLYFVPQTVLTGRTIGKRVVGLRVRLVEVDESPSWMKMSLRWTVMFGPTVFAGGLWLLLDCLWPLWDKSLLQALHDKAAKTIVVRSERTAEVARYVP